MRGQNIRPPLGERVERGCRGQAGGSATCLRVGRHMRGVETGDRGLGHGATAASLGVHVGAAAS